MQCKASMHALYKHVVPPLWHCLKNDFTTPSHMLKKKPCDSVGIQGMSSAMLTGQF